MRKNERFDAIAREAGDQRCHCLALGTGVTAGTATAQDDEEIVPFGDDYLTGTSFDVVSELD